MFDALIARAPPLRRQPAVKSGVGAARTAYIQFIAKHILDVAVRPSCSILRRRRNRGRLSGTVLNPALRYGSN